jgi:tripartite-type tricarboxylate transporter receptor subunit TctC
MKMRSLMQALVLVPALWLGTAAAQDVWPSKPVRLIVPSSPGGGTDTYARLLGQALGEQLKQPFVIDNKPGASGNIGAEAAARAEPDGYTFLVASNSSLGISPGLYKTMPFDIDRDFTPVARGVMAPMVIVAPVGARTKTFAELIELGRREPDKAFYGSAGTGSPLYIGVRMIEDASGARYSHVPYKGVAPAYQDLLSGRLDFMLTDLATIQQHIQGGKVVALAVNEKTPLLPNTPALADLGYPQIKAWTSFSVMAPSRVPPAIVQRLSSEISRAMKNPQVAQKLEQQALVPVFDTPETFAKSLKDERAHWAAFIRRKGITPDQ